MDSKRIINYLKNEGLLDKVQLDTHERIIITDVKKHLFNYKYSASESLSYKDTLIHEKPYEFTSIYSYKKGSPYTDKPADLYDHLLEEDLFKTIVEDLKITEEDLERSEKKKITASRSAYQNNNEIKK